MLVKWTTKIHYKITFTLPYQKVLFGGTFVAYLHGLMKFMQRWSLLGSRRGRKQVPVVVQRWHHLDGVVAKGLHSHGLVKVLVPHRAGRPIGARSAADGGPLLLVLFGWSRLGLLADHVDLEAAGPWRGPGVLLLSVAVLLLVDIHHLQSDLHLCDFSTHCEEIWGVQTLVEGKPRPTAWTRNLKMTALINNYYNCTNRNGITCKHVLTRLIWLNTTWYTHVCQCGTIWGRGTWGLLPPYDYGITNIFFPQLRLRCRPCTRIPLPHGECDTAFCVWKEHPPPPPLAECWTTFF